MLTVTIDGLPSLRVREGELIRGYTDDVPIFFVKLVEVLPKVPANPMFNIR